MTISRDESSGEIINRSPLLLEILISNSLRIPFPSSYFYWNFSSSRYPLNYFHYFFFFFCEISQFHRVIKITRKINQFLEFCRVFFNRLSFPRMIELIRRRFRKFESVKFLEYRSKLEKSKEQRKLASSFK